MLNDIRQSHLISWLNRIFSTENIMLSAMNGDAGFRRYFRFNYNNQSYVAVDAPKHWCNNNAFIDMQRALKSTGIVVPEIIAKDDEHGFFCLSDLGDTLLSDIVTKDNMANFYQQAINLLPTISSLPNDNLPKFTESFIQIELNIFVEWLLDKHLSIELSTGEQQQLNQCFSLLVANALAQPQVTMHRDFHSRNIMQISNETLAVIDFQDAVEGPITYDIVSLLRDCYLKWPHTNVLELLDHFIQLQTTHHNLTGISAKQWRTWFDLMGLQRHIKASGIFARLYHRDNKANYLHDIPLTLSYIVDISRQYDDLSFLGELVTEKVLPKLALLSVEECDE
ncbi:MAG: aminoglycoside phosphotransferase family protein [Thalassotalea sp.]